MWDTTTLREWLQAAANPLESFIKSASPSQRAVKVTKKNQTDKKRKTTVTKIRLRANETNRYQTIKHHKDKNNCI